MLYYVNFTDAGVPRTGLTPSFSSLATAENGTDVTATLTRSGTELSFNDNDPAADTITDTGSGFVSAGFKAGQKIRVTDTEHNDGVYTIATVAAGTITLSAGDSLTNEANCDGTITAHPVEEISSSNCPGWYSYDITFGTPPWDTLTEDLVGTIDGGAGLADVDRYKPQCISLRGLGLARIALKGVQSKSTGDFDIYATDGTTKEITMDMTDGAADVTRSPAAPA